IPADEDAPAVGSHAHAVGTGNDGYRRDNGSGVCIDHTHGIVLEVADISLRGGTDVTGGQHKWHRGEQQPGERDSNLGVHVDLLSCRGDATTPAPMHRPKVHDRDATAFIPRYLSRE